MKLEYDKEIDAAYIYLKERIRPDEVKQTSALSEHINLDFNKDNKLIGIEILEASKVIPKNIITQKVIA